MSTESNDDQDFEVSRLEDWSEAAPELRARSLFSDFEAGLPELLEHMAANPPKFNLLGAIAEHGLDQLGCIQLVNCIRASRSGVDPTTPFVLPSPAEFLSGEHFAPVIPDDGLLQFDYESVVESQVLALARTGLLLMYLCCSFECCHLVLVSYRR